MGIETILGYCVFLLVLCLDCEKLALVKHNTTSTPTMACSKFISQAVEMLMERDNLERHEALAQAERMAMEEGLMPYPTVNAKIRKARFVNATLGEQVPHAFAVVKRAKATTGLASDCIKRDKEFI